MRILLGLGLKAIIPTLWELPGFVIPMSWIFKWWIRLFKGDFKAGYA